MLNILIQKRNDDEIDETLDEIFDNSDRNDNN
jgi:hypothetical protein